MHDADGAGREIINMSTIFISHSSKDNDASNLLKGRLRAWGYQSFFLDFDPDSGIPAGQRWESELYLNIKSSQAVVVLCSAHSMASSWCFAEIAMAKAERKDIFPVRIDAGEFPIYPTLAEFQMLDLTAEDPESVYRRLRADLRRAGLDPEDDFDWDHSTREPYPGLNVFERDDAGVYFGRIEEAKGVIATLERMRRDGGPRLAVVVGASGSGKSSLVRAGVRPRLEKAAKSGDWLVVPPFRPKKRPIEELARALTDAYAAIGHMADWQQLRDQLSNDNGAVPVVAGTEPPLVTAAKDLTQKAGKREATALIIIDQFEELLDGRSGEDSVAFLRLLSRAVDWEGSPLLALLTLPSGSLDAFQTRAELGADGIIRGSAGAAARRAHFEPILLDPMPPERFPQIIEGPARRKGLEVEPGLVGRMALDTGTGTALPLLAFTLREMAHGFRPADQLSLAAYEKLGGIRGAVRSVAERIETEVCLLPVEEQEWRSLFVRMARIDADGRFVRQAVVWEADRHSRNVQAIVLKCKDARLLAERGDGNVVVLEVVHETLFQVWPRLAEWLRTERDAKEIHRRLSEAAREFEAGSEVSILYRGARLTSAEEWAASHAEERSDPEKAFLAASRRHENDERQKELRRERRRRQLLTTLAGAISLLLLVLTFGLYQRSEARNLRLATALKNQELKTQKLLTEKAEAAEKGNLALAYFSRGLRAEQDRDLPLAKVALTKALTLREGPEIRSRLARPWFAARLLWEGRSLSPRPGPTAAANDVFRAVLFTADGKQIVTAGDDHFVHLWTADTGKLEAMLDTGSPLISLALAPQGGLLAVGCKDGSVRMFDLPTKRLIRRFRPGKSVLAVAFSESGSLLALGLEGNGLHIVDATTGIELQSVGEGRYSARGVSFGPGDRHVAWVGNRYLHVTGVAEEAGGGIVGQQNSDLEAVAWCPNQLVVAAAGHDRTINVWDFDDGPKGTHSFILSTRPASREQVRELVGHTLAVTSLAFSRDSQLLASGGQEGDLRVWDWRAKRLLLTVNVPEGGILGVAIAPDSRRVAAVGQDSRIRVWELGREQGAPVYDHTALPEYNSFAAATPQASNYWVWEVAFLKERELAVKLAGGSLHRFDVRTGKLLGTLVKSDAMGFTRENHVCLSWDSRRLAVQNGEKVTIYRVGGAAAEREITLPKARILGWSPDGEGLLAEIEEGSVRVVDPKSPEKQQVLITHVGKATVLAVCHAPQRAAFGWSDGTVMVWDFAAGHALAAPPREGEWVASAAFDSKGQHLAVATRGIGGSALVWDVAAGTPAYRIDHQVLRVAFSPDGRWLALGSAQDGTTWLHWANDGGLAGVLEGHAKVVTALAFSPDSQLLVSGSEDNTARRWSMPEIERLWSAPAAELLAEAELQSGLAFEELDPRSRSLPPPPSNEAGIAVVPKDKGDAGSSAEEAAALRNEAEHARVDHRDSKRALATATRAVELADLVMKEGNPAAMRLWVSCRVTLGDALSDEGDGEKSLACYRMVVERLTKYLVGSPGDIAPEMLRAYDRFAQALLKAKKSDEAHDIEERAIRLHGSLLERGRIQVSGAAALESRYLRLIERLKSQKRSQESVDRYQELLAILRTLAARSTTDRPEFSARGSSVASPANLLNQGIAVNEERLADLLFELDRLQEAFKSYSAALKLREDLLFEMVKNSDERKDQARLSLAFLRFKTALTLFGIANEPGKDDPKVWNEVLNLAENARALYESIGKSEPLPDAAGEAQAMIENMIKESKSHIKTQGSGKQ
jgi:WD40 repeat protein/tetratricopeptide (TPR) repeat protein